MNFLSFLGNDDDCSPDDNFLYPLNSKKQFVTQDTLICCLKGDTFVTICKVKSVRAAVAMFPLVIYVASGFYLILLFRGFVGF